MPKAPGPGSITAKGYLRARRGGRPRLLHHWEWEQHHGPVPDGFHVHHVNEIKTDNAIENLELLSAVDHRRTHSKHYRRNADGEWERRCNACDEWKPADAENYYLSREGWLLYGRCRPCHIRDVVQRKQRQTAKG